MKCSWPVDYYLYLFFFDLLSAERCKNRAVSLWQRAIGEMRFFSQTWPVPRPRGWDPVYEDVSTVSLFSSSVFFHISDFSSNSFFSRMNELRSVIPYQIVDNTFSRDPNASTSPSHDKNFLKNKATVDLFSFWDEKDCRGKWRVFHWPCQRGQNVGRNKKLTKITSHLPLPGGLIDYRCNNRRFWLSAHNCQFPTPTSQNLELEEQIRIFGAD